jgi:hypothetical protein
MNDVNKVSRKLEHFFEEMGEKAQALTLLPSGPPDVEKLMTLAARYHVEIKGAPPQEN